MAEPDLIAVQATEKRFYALTHQPSGLPLDEAGKGFWPADQFTFRLIQEDALKRVEDKSDTTPSKGK